MVKLKLFRPAVQYSVRRPSFPLRDARFGRKLDEALGEMLTSSDIAPALDELSAALVSYNKELSHYVLGMRTELSFD